MDKILTLIESCTLKEIKGDNIMAKFEKTITGEFEAVVREIDRCVMNNGASMNLVDQSDHKLNETNIAVRVYDKYFMRNKSRASLSVTIIGQDDQIFITAIGAGGGQGVIFNFSLGAESEMVDIVSNCVNKMAV
jgi:hypothetical protein